MRNQAVALAFAVALLLMFPLLLWSASPNNRIIQKSAPDSSGGPDAYGYTWIDIYEPGGPEYNWIDITGIGIKVEGLTDDNNVGPFPIGFDFPYYGYYCNQFFVNANGAISFSDPQVYVPQGGSGFIIPCMGDPDDLIIPLGADLVFQAIDTAACYYYSNNIDTLIVSYINVAAWDTGGISGVHTFQLILTRQDSCIYFQYGRQQGQYYNDANCAGIENSGGYIGLQVFYFAMPDSGYAVKFAPPDSVSGVEESDGKFPKPASIQVSVSPNPFTTSTTITLQWESETRRIGETVIHIYNVSGRRVREMSLVTCNLLAGATWDGRDEAGKVLPPGIYFLKLDGKPVGKVVKVR
jgi:hypothetical protein